MLEKLKTLFYLFLRAATSVSPSLAVKALTLGAGQGRAALKAYRRRLNGLEYFPPFLFFSLPKKCALRCPGCSVRDDLKPEAATSDGIELAIREGRRRDVRFITFLSGDIPRPTGASDGSSVGSSTGTFDGSSDAVGIVQTAPRCRGGEPFLWSEIWNLIGKFPDCYFLIMTNGQYLTSKRIDKIKNFGNISPLVCIDGLKKNNDARRGEGTFEKAMSGCRRLQAEKILFGVATVVTSKNLEEVLSDDYVLTMIDVGAIYLRYSMIRPIEDGSSAKFALDAEQILYFRRRLLDLRKRMPILLVDTCWDARGRAVCPAASGLGLHIGPSGSVEPCGALPVYREKISDNFGDLFKTVNGSLFLRHFRKFAEDHWDGCVMMEKPGELGSLFEQSEAYAAGAGHLFEELKNAAPSPSHAGVGMKIPEDFWFYRYLKNKFFMK